MSSVTCHSGQLRRLSDTVQCLFVLFPSLACHASQSGNSTKYRLYIDLYRHSKLTAHLSVQNKQTMMLVLKCRYYAHLLLLLLLSDIMLLFSLYPTFPNTVLKGLWGVNFCYIKKKHKWHIFKKIFFLGFRCRVRCWAVGTLQGWHLCLDVILCKLGIKPCGTKVILHCPTVMETHLIFLFGNGMPAVLFPVCL